VKSSLNVSFSLFADVSPTEHEDLFIKKLRQCCVAFNFLEHMEDLKGKEIKRAALNELVDFITANRGALTEPVYPEIIQMVSLRGACMVGDIISVTTGDEYGLRLLEAMYEVRVQSNQYKMVTA